MPQAIEKELVKCEEALYVMQTTYPNLAIDAANARFVYDQAWADAIDSIIKAHAKEGGKLPTVAAMEATATKQVAEQMEAARQAEAKLDGAKKNLDTLQAILSSVQTRAKLVQIELGLAR